MKKYLVIILFFPLLCISCGDTPLDEDNLLITTRSECYVSSFGLVGFDHQTVINKNNVKVDTVAQIIDVEVVYGTNLKKLYPQFTLVTDAKLTPKITGFVDFSDLNNPKQYTVISGNRKVQKTYTVNITVQSK